MTKTVTMAAATAGHAEGSTTLNAFDNALLAAGIGCFEITLNEPEADALGSIALLARRFAGRLLVGAGTVLSIGAAERAIDAGATFLVSPHTDEALIGWAAARGARCSTGRIARRASRSRSSGSTRTSPTR